MRDLQSRQLPALRCTHRRDPRSPKRDNPVPVRSPNGACALTRRIAAKLSAVWQAAQCR